MNDFPDSQTSHFLKSQAVVATFQKTSVKIGQIN